MKKLLAITIAAAFLLAAYFGLAWWLMMAPPRPHSFPPLSPAEKKWFESRMKYHGINSCIRDETGHYFIRDGKRCKL